MIAFLARRRDRIRNNAAAVERADALMDRMTPAPQHREPQLHLATHDDGSQSLVTIHADGTAQLATRVDPWATWGAPVELSVAP